MFIGTLTIPLFNHLIRSSSFRFTELILTREHVEGGIRSGKIQVAMSSSDVKKKFNGKKEKNVVYGQKGRSRSDCNQSVWAVLILIMRLCNNNNNRVINVSHTHPGDSLQRLTCHCLGHYNTSFP